MDLTGTNRWSDNVLIMTFSNGASLYQSGVKELTESGWPAENIGLLIALAEEVITANPKPKVAEVHAAVIKDEINPTLEQAEAIWLAANTAAELGVSVLQQ